MYATRHGGSSWLFQNPLSFDTLSMHQRTNKSISPDFSKIAINLIKIVVTPLEDNNSLPKIMSSKSSLFPVHPTCPHSLLEADGLGALEQRVGPNELASPLIPPPRPTSFLPPCLILFSPYLTPYPPCPTLFPSLCPISFPPYLTPFLPYLIPFPSPCPTPFPLPLPCPISFLPCL